MNIEELIADRRKTHGDYHAHASYTQDIKRVIRKAEQERAMRGDMPLIDTEREALDMIAHKIGRILAGRSDFRDHWSDIIGYARLVERELEQQSPSPT